MSFQIKSLARPRRIAKALKSSLGRHGVQWTLSQCQEAVSRMYERADWHALVNSLSETESPADRDAPAYVAEERRSLHVSVLISAGVDADMAESVIDEVRPTGRGAKRSPFPRVLVEAFEKLPDGSKRSLGIQDVTPSVIAMFRYRHPQDVMHRLREGLLLHDVAEGLTAEAKAVGYARRLALPRIADRVEEFLQAIGHDGSYAAVERYRTRLARFHEVGRHLKEAESELKSVRKAKFVEDASKFSLFYGVAGYGPFSREGFYESASEMYDDWGYDEYTRVASRPDWDKPERKVWDEGYAAFRRDRVPPFVFGTRPEEWKGISPREIREMVEDYRLDEDDDMGPLKAGDLDIEEAQHVLEMCFESDMENFHEDASDGVEAWDEIAKAFGEWLPHAGTGNEVDVAFDAIVLKWNEKQSIVTYYPNLRVIVPCRKGVTKEDAVRWCMGRVSQLRSELEVASQWEVEPAPEPEAETGHRPVVGRF